MNWSALLSIARTVTAHPAAKGSALGTVVLTGLYAATLAGIAIPAWAFTAGPIAGYIVYKFLPTKAEQAIDDAEGKLADIVTTIPSTYQEFPGDDKKLPPAVTNINKS